MSDRLAPEIGINRRLADVPDEELDRLITALWAEIDACRHGMTEDDTESRLDRLEAFVSVLAAIVARNI